MHAQLKQVPAGWKPNDPDAIARWMRKLPTVKDLDTVAEIDLNYQKMQEHHERKY